MGLEAQTTILSSMPITFLGVSNCLKVEWSKIGVELQIVSSFT